MRMHHLDLVHGQDEPGFFLVMILNPAVWCYSILLFLLVQAMDSKSNTYHGNLGSQNLRALQFSQVLESLRDGTEGGLYLAQAPILEDDETTDLAGMLEDFTVPPCPTVASINLWMSGR